MKYSVVLLPLFFAFSGLRTNISSVKGELWLYTLLVIAAAITGKFGDQEMKLTYTGKIAGNEIKLKAEGGGGGQAIEWVAKKQ